MINKEGAEGPVEYGPLKLHREREYCICNFIFLEGTSQTFIFWHIDYGTAHNSRIQLILQKFWTKNLIWPWANTFPEFRGQINILMRMSNWSYPVPKLGHESAKKWIFALFFKVHRPVSHSEAENKSIKTEKRLFLFTTLKLCLVENSVWQINKLGWAIQY